MSEPIDEELARLVYEELIVEFPGYKAVPEPMAKALIRLGVNNGIRFSTVSTDKLSVEKLQEQLNTAEKYIEHAIGTIKHDGHLGTIQTDLILSYLEKALAALEGGEDE